MESATVYESVGGKHLRNMVESVGQGMRECRALSLRQVFHRVLPTLSLYSSYILEHSNNLEKNLSNCSAKF